jgi:hypothetical protein
MDVHQHGKKSKQDLFNENVSFMEICKDTEELEMFDTEVIQDMIEFKWLSFGRAHHMMGLTMHFVYTFTLTIYVNEVYLAFDDHNQHIYTVLLGLALLYPIQYETK